MQILGVLLIAVSIISCNSHGQDPVYKSDSLNNYKNKDRSFLVITHYQSLLKYIEPDVVHVLIDGKIIKSGGKELALELEEKGYSWLES